MKMRSEKRAIDKIYKRRDRYEVPGWQRGEVWSRSKKQNLIDTILRGWKLPKFYFVRISIDPEEYEVVDGQQRLAAIFEFFDNELPLPDEAAKLFGGTHYRSLPDKLVDAFDDYEIQFDEIEDASEEDVKLFFQRLQEGLPLTSSEKLNSVPSKLRDFVNKATKHTFFQNLGASNRRHGHLDILAKVAAVEVDGLDVGLRFDDLRAVFESQAAFAPNSNVGKRIIAALDYAQRGFGDESQALRNRTVVQSLLTLICRLLQSPHAARQEHRVAQFFRSFLTELNRQVELGSQATEPDYIEFQRSVNANTKAGARIRQQILVRRLLTHDATFAELLDPFVVAESGVRNSIAQDAAAIVTAIGRLNEQFAAKHGDNLFKPTNRTAQAQARIGVPLQDFDGYKNLIDDLYFLCHEGVGARLDPHKPEAFKDIGILRTDLQHDVEHGEQSSIRSKKKKIGHTFAKYAGAQSPHGLAPERFILVQASVLTAVRAAVASIKV